MAYHTRGVKFGGGSFGVHAPMSDDDIRAVAPAVFAGQPHDSRSPRYGYIPTVELLRGMREEGFVVVNAVQGRSRIAGKAAFTKHMLRFQRVDFVNRHTQLGGVAPQALLVNSHDGTSSYHLFGGIFRSICKNCLICMEDGAMEIKVPHRNNIVADVIEGSYTVINESEKRLEVAAEWSDLRLNRDEQLALAEGVRTVRFGDSEGVVTSPITAEQLLVARRYEDRGDSLWLTTNVLQENCMRGGVIATAHYNGQRPTRRVTSKAINGIDGDVKLNRALWALSVKMAELVKR